MLLHSAVFDAPRVFPVQAAFGLPGETPQWCMRCAKPHPGATNLLSKKCALRAPNKPRKSRAAPRAPFGLS